MNKEVIANNSKAPMAAFVRISGRLKLAQAFKPGLTIIQD